MDYGDILVWIIVVLIIGGAIKNRLGITAAQVKSVVLGWMRGASGGRAFGLKLLSITLGVLILDAAIAQTGWFPAMFSGWGWTHLGFYLVVGVGLAVATSTPGKIGEISYKLIIIACIVLGAAETYHLAFGCDAACQLRKQEAAAAQARIEAARRIAIEAAWYPGCTRQIVEHRFGTSPGDPINPTGTCAADFWMDGPNCVYQKRASGKTYGPYGDCKAAEEYKNSPDYHPPPVDVVYTWSAGDAFVGRFKLSPRRYVQWFQD